MAPTSRGYVVPNGCLLCPAPISAHWGDGRCPSALATTPRRGLLPDLLRRALGDPGSFTPRGDSYAEEIIDWQRRAVLIALAAAPIDERVAAVGLRRVGADCGPHDDLFEEIHGA